MKRIRRNNADDSNFYQQNESAGTSGSGFSLVSQEPII
jgi:hypothetical protein